MNVSDHGDIYDYRCRYCQRPITRIHPELRYELQWGHTSSEDAAACVPKAGDWPRPA